MLPERAAGYAAKPRKGSGKMEKPPPGDKKRDNKKRSREGRDRLEVNSGRLILAGVLFVQFVPLVVLGGVLYPFISPKAFLFMAAAQFIFLVWVFLAINRPKFRPAPNPVLFCLAALLAALTLSTIFSAVPAVSFWSNFSRATGLLMQLHLFAFFLVLSSFFKTDRQWQLLFATAVSIAVLVSLWGLADNYDLLWLIAVYDVVGLVSEDVRLLSGGGGTLGNTSYMGTYLLFNAFFALFLFFRSGPRGRVAWALTFSLIATGLMLNPGGRAMKGAFLAGLIIAGLLYLAFCHRRGPVMIAARVFTAAGLIGGIFFGLTAFQEGSPAYRLVYAMVGMPGRMVNWAAAWHGFLERPLFGWGPENFEIALQRHFDPQVLLPDWGFVAEGWHDRAHNVVFEYLVTTGLTGTIIYLALLASALLVLWRACLKEERVPCRTAAILTGLFGAHFILNLTTFDTVTSYILFYMVLAYCAVIKTGGREGGGEAGGDRYYRSGYFTLPLVALLVAALVFSFNHFAFKPFLAGRVVRLALEDPYGKSLAEVERMAAALTPMGRQQIRFQLGVAASVLLEIAGEEKETIEEFRVEEGSSFYAVLTANNNRQAELLLADMEHLIGEAQKSIEESPLSYRLYYDLGRLNKAYSEGLSRFARGGDDRPEMAYRAALAAEEAYRQAIAISPANVESYWGLGEAVILQGELLGSPERFREALAIAEAALKIEPRFKESHDLVLRAASLLEDEKLLRKKYLEAISIVRAWAKDFVHYFDE